MAENKLTVLGSSSGLPQAHRASSGYLLQVNDRLSLLDCGGGVTQSFLRCRFDPLAVDRIFISHTHPDHCSDIPLFLQMVYLNGRKEPFEVYVPDEFVDVLTKYLYGVYLIKERLPFELKIIGYDDGFVYDEDFKLKAIANKHLFAYEEFIARLKLPNNMQCHSFDMQIDETKLLYSSDVSSFDDIKNYLKGRDTVVLEVTHIYLKQFFEHAKTVDVGQYVITHLGSDDEIDRIKIMAANFGIDNLITAHDGMEINL